MPNPKRFVDPSDVSGVLASRDYAVNGITANPGGGQANATLLTGAINRVTVVATAGDSVKLPAAKAGNRVEVINGQGVNSMNVFPQSGESMADVVNASQAIAPHKVGTFICAVDGNWSINLGA